MPQVLNTYRRSAQALFAVAAFFCASSVLGQGLSPRFAKSACVAPTWMPEILDYYAPSAQMRVAQIESNHFDANVEALVRGKTGSLGADIDFLLRYVPNHPRALGSLVRLALRENTPQPAGVSIPVECYFLRGLEFRPDDTSLLTLYGTYLARVNRPREALARFQEAEKLMPDDAVLLYNIGSVLLTLGDYERARYYAEKAYGVGIDLPGLRDKLIKLGHWRQ